MISIDPLPLPNSPHSRLTTAVQDKQPSFRITADNRTYKHQYANIYFVRLRLLRQSIEQRAIKRWKTLAGNPVFIPRVLEVVKSQLCYVVGTVYMDMPLKPNVLEDIARDQSIPPPPPLKKFHSIDDNVMLEDESGRIKLVGDRVTNAKLVTGVVIGALGMETSNGEFEVVDICYAGMASQYGDDVKMQVDDAPVASSSSQQTTNTSDEWIALISGLDIGSSSPSEAQIQLLVENLTGEGGGPEDQSFASQISRLIIVGNSLAAPIITNDSEGDKKSRRYGYDFASFSPHPTISLSAHLLDLAHVMPIHILPGARDPSGTILPQQPFPRAMFGAAASFASFNCETNPTYLRIKTEESNRPEVSRTFLVNSGQPLNDMFKYVPSPPITRLSLAESTLRWRHMAPTAPDTLWCHPYFAADPFIIQETPHVYVIGDQPRFQTKVVVDEDSEGTKSRIILLPRFGESGMMVLVNLRTLDVKTVEFTVEGMAT